ncbi:ferredoxin [Streptomyces flavidovirens]|uniref:ferredoxin n=1 Tax=Streptomyces flavidovirens TaxID=67298 RepID=UPI00048D67D5|nr:ferredoxin [Streptomyces flavidovirens]
MRVGVDRDRCCGAGQCVMSAPAVFDQSESDGLVLLRQGWAGSAVRGDVELAVALCPANAISVEDDAGKA